MKENYVWYSIFIIIWEKERKKQASKQKGY